MVQRYHGADMLERITAPSDAIFFAEVVTSMTVRNPKPYILNPKPKSSTLNPKSKPSILNPKP